MRSQSPEEKAKERQKKCDTHGRLVGDVACPWACSPRRIEAVGWVTGLRGTGSDPEPSPQRAVLVEEMQRRGVENPNALLASHNASLVLVRARASSRHPEGRSFRHRGAGAQPQRDHEPPRRLPVGNPLDGNATMEDDGMIHSGRDRGIAQGPILVDPTADARNENDRLLLDAGANPRRRHVLSLPFPGAGDQARTQGRGRQLPRGRRGEQAIPLLPERHRDRRGHRPHRRWIELNVHPQYKDNLDRYMQVVRAVAIQESSAEQMQRLTQLETETVPSGRPRRRRPWNWKPSAARRPSTCS